MKFNLFKNVEELESRVSDLSQQVSLLESSLTSVTEERDEAINAAAEATNECEALYAQLEDFKNGVNTSQDVKLAEAEAAIDNLKEAVAAAEDSASLKAVEIAASQGIPAPVAVEAPEDPAAVEVPDVFAQFNAITDPAERTQFWRENYRSLVGGR
jgi:vacuolar-type H+-ATPase subunit I/STV1